MINSSAVDDLLLAQQRLATHRQLTALGIPISTTTYRIRPSGPWQRLLPGVVLCHRGTPTFRERLLGALLFGGDGSVITGLPALALRGVRAAQDASSRRVHILVPEPRQRSSFGYVDVERTRRLPAAHRIDGLPVAPVARALVDAARGLSSPDSVRALVAEVIQRRLCSVSQLGEAVKASARQRTALSRHILLEMSDGVRSVVESRAREVLLAAGVPAAEWNVALYGRDHEFLAIPDAYWAGVAAALQIDSMTWHLSPAAYKRTQERQRAMTVHGVLVLPVAPDHVLGNADTFVNEVRELLAAAQARPLPTGVQVGPHPMAA